MMIIVPVLVRAAYPTWLDELPYMGRKASELNEEHIREFALYSYRIIYEIKNVEILAVIHKRQDLQAEEIFGGARKFPRQL